MTVSYLISYVTRRAALCCGAFFCSIGKTVIFRTAPFCRAAVAFSGLSDERSEEFYLVFEVGAKKPHTAAGRPEMGGGKQYGAQSLQRKAAWVTNNTLAILIHPS